MLKNCMDTTAWEGATLGGCQYRVTCDAPKLVHSRDGCWDYRQCWDSAYKDTEFTYNKTFISNAFSWTCTHAMPEVKTCVKNSLCGL